MKGARNMRVMGQYGTIGIEMVLSMLAGLWIGSKLDPWLHTDPWMKVLWFFFGCGAAGRTVYRAWRGMQKDALREEALEGNPAPAFLDDKALAWQREEERKQRAVREDGEDASDAAIEAEVEKLASGAKANDAGAEKRHD